MTDIDLNLLLAFDALYHERQVTRAARRVGIGQPAMSAALARMRAALGDELFVRTGEGMQPTPKAQRMAPVIAASLRSLQSALAAEMPFEPRTARNTFTIASTDYTSQVLLPGLVSRIRREAPQTNLHVISYEKQSLGSMLARNDIDIALGVFPEPPPDCVRSNLYEEHFVGLARAGHPAFRTGEPDLATFAGLPHALVTVRQDARGAIDEVLAGQGLSRRIALTLPHMNALASALRESDLIAAIPSRIAPGLAQQGLRLFELPLQVPAWNVSMLWTPYSRADKGLAWLRAQVIDTAAAPA